MPTRCQLSPIRLALSCLFQLRPAVLSSAVCGRRHETFSLVDTSDVLLQSRDLLQTQMNQTARVDVLDWPSGARGGQQQPDGVCGRDVALPSCKRHPERALDRELQERLWRERPTWRAATAARADAVRQRRYSGELAQRTQQDHPRPPTHVVTQFPLSLLHAKLSFSRTQSRAADAIETGRIF